VFAAGDPARFAALARQLWACRDDQADLSARCMAYTDREHAIGAVVARWERVLGLPGRGPAPDRAPAPAEPQAV
jgi:hypothetical protein